MVSALRIVDAQVHVWAPDSPERPWPPGRAHMAQKPYAVTPDIVLAAMDQAGVDAAVLVPPSWEGDRNDLALDAARRHPARFAVMGRLPVERPETSRALLPTWRAQPGMLGLRFTFRTAEQRPWLTDGTADWLWPAAEQAGVPLMLYVPGSLPVVDRIAERHPGLRIVIDHMAIDVHARDAEAFAHLPELVRLARRPNVAVKASALPCHTSEPYPYRGIHDHIRRVFDAFGPRRTFWGTDWTRLPCSWRQAVTLFTEELPWLAGEDLQWVMGRALCVWLDWRPPAA